MNINIKLAVFTGQMTISNKFLCSELKFALCIIEVDHQNGTTASDFLKFTQIYSHFPSEISKLSKYVFQCCKMSI